MKIGIRLNPNSHTPVTVQIVDRIRRLINTGKIAAGDLLPSSRSAATAWDVDFTTVARAYQKLKAEGLIESNSSRRLVVSEKVKSMSERDRMKLLSPMILGLKAQARELGLPDSTLRGEIARILKWPQATA